MDIRGKTALITGGASGLGLACVRMFTAAGGRVVVADLKPPSDAEPGDSAVFAKTDVTESAQIEVALHTAIERFGGLHVLINCAGIGDAARVVGKDGPMALERFTRVISVNLIGTFNAIRLAAAGMCAAEPDAGGERGVIINTASIAAFDGQIGQAAYSASKGGIVGMTLPLARDLARHGVRVMTIAPGLFDTPLLAGLPEPARQALAESIPFPPRLGRPDEYAQLARQIIENPMLNGSVIRLDGALRMAPR
ncbi:MAG TPA: 3-hydroxyacyl-CoA dehydrogenase [Bryobacteraceae bacterium]|jgi:NAD(P)-dependent dehydrogenase (short-subunit alcohol dehydrogenase family)|nr:3-hydroxyacyl-CoA dehydrogenase [Bryobacteraceae bacterium]